MAMVYNYIFMIRYFLILNLMCNAQNEILEEDKVRPGFYHQWREKVPSTHPDNPYYKPDCHAKCVEKCGANHKGVSVCGSMFEYADDPLKVEVMNFY